MTAKIGTNSFKTYEAIGIKEDLSDIISDISPTDTPFSSMAGRSTAKNTYHEWQTDELAAPADNAHLESEEAEIAATTPTTRVGNYTQIFQKTCSVSATEQSVNKAGRANEMAYQMVKRGKELNKDMELAFLSNKASNAGNASTPRRLRGLPSWIVSNLSKGSGAKAGSASTPFTPGTKRALTEDLLLNTIQLGYENGANFSKIMVAPKLKVLISQNFGGSNDGVIQTRPQESSTAGTAISVYKSDFGLFDVVPNRIMKNAASELDLQSYLFLIDPAMVSIATLRPTKSVELAKTGDNEKRMLVTERTLVVKNEKGLGMIADIDIEASGAPYSKKVEVTNTTEKPVNTKAVA